MNTDFQSEMDALPEEGDFEEKALLEIDRLADQLKQRDETIKQLKEEYKYKRMDTVHKHNVALFKENQQLKSEIETLKKAFQDIFPIIDFMVTENDLHLHLMDNEIIDKARKLIAE